MSLSIKNDFLSTYCQNNPVAFIHKQSWCKPFRFFLLTESWPSCVLSRSVELKNGLVSQCSCWTNYEKVTLFENWFNIFTAISYSSTSRKEIDAIYQRKYWLCWLISLVKLFCVSQPGWAIWIKPCYVYFQIGPVLWKGT